MAKGTSQRLRAKQKPAQPSSGASGWQTRIAALLTRHEFTTVAHPSWVWLPYLLGLAFVLRAAVGLSGDFVVHPDEIFQYLEPAHRVVFGNGVGFWEFFYGGRSWLVPSIVAGILYALDFVGLGHPQYYIPTVKLFFCAVSLLLPWGLYHFARAYYSEGTARLVTIFVCLWPFTVGYAHKPFTEMLSVYFIFAGLGIASLPVAKKNLGLASVGFLLAMGAFLRFQYAPVALVLWFLFLIRKSFWQLVLIVVASLAAALLVAIVEWLSWGIPYWSYYTNFMVNIKKEELGFIGDHTFYLDRFVYWSGALVLLAIWAGLRHRVRYLLPTSLWVLMLFLHSVQLHAELRYIFICLPLVLLIAADWIDRLAGNVEVVRSWLHGSMTAVVAVFASLVLLNALPGMKWLHEADSFERGEITFLRGHSNMWDIYRQLASADNVTGVLHVGDAYFNSPGYYYLHHKVPFYEEYAINEIGIELDLDKVVSHIVAKQDLDVDGFTLVRHDGDYRLYESNRAGEPVLQWLDYKIFRLGQTDTDLVRLALGEAPRVALFEVDRKSLFKL